MPPARGSAARPGLLAWIPCDRRYWEKLATPGITCTLPGVLIEAPLDANGVPSCLDVRHVRNDQVQGLSPIVRDPIWLELSACTIVTVLPFARAAAIVAAHIAVNTLGGSGPK
jgi:hypothetical protein